MNKMPSSITYPTQTSYGYDELGGLPLPSDYTDYTQSALSSPDSEQSSTQLQNPLASTAFIPSNPVETPQKLDQTCDKGLAQRHSPQRSQSDCNSHLLGDHCSNQPENVTFNNHTSAGSRRPRSPSAASMVSKEKISRPHQPLPTSTERCGSKYPCQVCDKKFNTVSQRK